MQRTTPATLALGLLALGACRTRLPDGDVAAAAPRAMCSDPQVLSTGSSPGGGNNPAWVRIADFDGDGHLDLIGVSLGVSVLLGDGKRGFAPSRDLLRAAPAQVATVGDVDGDGRADVIFAQRVGLGDGPIEILRGTAGALKASTLLAASNALWLSSVKESASSTVLTVLSGAVKAGWAVRSYEVERDLTNTYLGALSGSEAFGSASFVLVGDLLGTSTSESFFVPEDSPHLIAWGPWGRSKTSVQATAIHDLALGDFDGDGKPDLAAVNYVQSGDNVVTLRGHGDGNFDPPLAMRAGDFPVAVVTLDWNRDGKLDVAVANSGNDHTVSIFFGKGDGTFFDAVPCTAVTFDSLGGPLWLDAGDLDGDGFADLAFAFLDGVTVVWNGGGP